MSRVYKTKSEAVVIVKNPAGRTMLNKRRAYLVRVNGVEVDSKGTLSEAKRRGEWFAVRINKLQGVK